MRMIVQAEALRRTEGHWTHYIIHELPTIDAVPVVRCKDCKHRYTNACPVREFALEFRDEEHGYQNINFQIKEITHDCGFCYRGEKMDGGADNANY